MSDWVSRELHRFNDTNAGKRNEYRRKLKEEEMLKKEHEGGPRRENDGGIDDEERAAKRARMGDDADADEGTGPDGGVGMNGHANGDESTMNGHEVGDEDDPIDLGEKDDEDGNEDEDGGQEDEEEPEEEPAEEDEEDDEDAFPDEGRRLSSVEAETYTDGEARARPVPEDETMSDEESE